MSAEMEKSPYMRQWREMIDKEDTSRLRAHIQQQGTGVVHLTDARANLLEFCHAQRDRGTHSSAHPGWAKVLQDPTAAAAMRALKRRVDSLQGTAAPTSQWGNARLNSHVNGSYADHRHPLLFDSPMNPLSVEAMTRPRAVPVGEVPNGGQSSLWAPSFGATASDQPVDLNFRYAREFNARGGGYARR